MFEKIISSKLFQYIITITIAILTVILTQSYIDKRKSNEAFNLKADKCYVDSQDKTNNDAVKQLRIDIKGDIGDMKSDLREVRNYIYSLKK